MNKPLKTLAKGISISLLATLLITGCGETYRHESTGQFVDNTALTVKVKTKLLADRQVEGLPITVKSFKNEVQLSGFVNSYAQSKRAAQLAASVPGVKKVRNNLVVK